MVIGLELLVARGFEVVQPLPARPFSESALLDHGLKAVFAGMDDVPDPADGVSHSPRSSVWAGVLDCCERTLAAASLLRRPMALRLRIYAKRSKAALHRKAKRLVSVSSCMARRRGQRT